LNEDSGRKRTQTEEKSDGFGEREREMMDLDAIKRKSL
jgi:hypothetical protein